LTTENEKDMRSLSRSPMDVGDDIPAPWLILSSFAHIF